MAKINEKKDESILIIPISSGIGLDELFKSASVLTESQLFNADAIASEKHLRLAFFHANRAFDEKTNQAKSLKMEFLLQAAATGQIKVAVETCGVKNTERMLLAIWGKDKERVEEILSSLKAERAKWEMEEDKEMEKEVIRKMVEAQTKK